MPGRKTVLFVQHYPDGGSITGLFDLIRGLDPDRYRPVVSFRTPNPFVPEFEAAGIPVVVLDPEALPDPLAARAPDRAPRRTHSSPVRREMGRLLRRDLPAARRLRRVIRDHGVDLVHANNDVLSNRDAILAAMVTLRPVVVHVRWLHTYENDATLRIDKALARRPARFFFMSQAVADGCRPLEIPAERQAVLDDPFHVADYDVVAPPGLAAELAIPAGGRVVLHVGRIIPWKGQDVFLRAMATVLLADRDAVGLLVGSPTDLSGRRFLAQLKALAADLGIDHRIIFAGSRRDVPRLIALSEVVVHCSTTPEPFGRVVVEAMAGGRPVIGADAGGVPEIIHPGVTGLLVAPGDHEQLGVAISDLLSDPDEAAALGRRAREAVADRFTIEAHGDTVQAAYDEVLSA